SDVVVQSDAEHSAFAQHVERSGGGKRTQVVETLFVVCTAHPVHGITAVLAFALEVVNLHACDLITRWITQQKNREISCFNSHTVRRCADKNSSVAHRVHGAIKLTNGRIDSHTRSHV